MIPLIFEFFLLILVPEIRPWFIFICVNTKNQYTPVSVPEINPTRDWNWNFDELFSDGFDPSFDRHILTGSAKYCNIDAITLSATY